MRVSVIGLGRVGLPLATFIAEKGFNVIGADVDEKKVDKINKGINPIPNEEGLGKLIKKHVNKRFVATTNVIKAVKESTVHLIDVPLLLDENKNPDFSYLEKSLRAVGKGLKKEDLVIIETTVPPLTTEVFVKKILEEESGLTTGRDFYLCHSPERVMAGRVLDRLKNFQKVIGGVDEISSKKGFEFYSQIIPNLKVVSNARTAEITKIVEGVYRDTNIALANELFKVCKELGIDFTEVRTNAQHEFCHLHKPGVGVGGHCIPVYPWFIIKEMVKRGKEITLIKTARKVNEEMIHYWKDILLKRIKKTSKPINKVKVCVKGLTFRPGVKIVTNSRGVDLAKLLQDSGLNVYCRDELLSKEEVEKLDLKYCNDLSEMDIVFDVFNLKFITIEKIE